MKNFLVFLTLMSLFASCRKGEYAYNEVDLQGRKNLYRLYIAQDSDDNYYYSNKNGKCDVLVTNDVLVDGNLFGGFNNVHKAVAHARAIGAGRVDQVTAISIRKINGEFEKTWQFYNPVDLNKDQTDGSFGVYEVDVTPDEAYFEHEKGSDSGIKIVFNEADTGKGFRTMILNFVRQEGAWKFLYKEKIDTRFDSDVSYCRDSTSYNGFSEKLPHNISYTDLFDYFNSRCK